MSYRKKRIRKKLRVGEFQELCFHVSGKLKRVDSNSYDRFADCFIDFMESVNLFIGGGPSVDGFSFWVDGGPRSKITEDDRSKVLKFLESQSNIKEVKVGELRDAWHGWSGELD